jgi:hypothetical protein
MWKAGVVAVTVAILTLALVAVGCGSETASVANWETLVEASQEHNSGGPDVKTTSLFELTGAPCRLRYETQTGSIQVYLVPKDDSTTPQRVLDSEKSPQNGEVMLSPAPGIYSLEIVGATMIQYYHLWVEEQL